MSRVSLVEDALVLSIRWVLLAIAIWIASQTARGIHLDGWRGSLVAAVVLGSLNTFIRPFITRNALPVTLVTFGLFLLLLNALLLMLAARLANPIEEVSVNGFSAAFLGALIISSVGLVARATIDPEKVAGNFMHFAGRKY